MNAQDDAFKTWWYFFAPHVMCFQSQRHIQWFVSNVFPLAKQVPPYLCRLGQTRFLPMKCSKYISVTSFAMLNQHSLGTEFSWKFLQNITHWRGYFNKGWFSKWNKRGSERFIGLFQSWKELCWRIRGWLCKLGCVAWASREWASVSSFCLKLTLCGLDL